MWSAPLCLVTNSWNSGCAPRFDRTPPRAASGRAVSTLAPGVSNRGSSCAASLRPPWTWFIDAIALSAASVSTPSSCADATESSSSAPVAASATRRAKRGGEEVVRRDITVVRRARADATKVSSEMSRPPTSPGGAGTRSSERSVSSRRWVARPGVVCDGRGFGCIVSELLFPNFSWRLQTNRAQIVWANGHEAGKNLEIANQLSLVAEAAPERPVHGASRRARLPARCKTAGARAVWRVRRGHSAARTHRWRWGACESTRWAAVPGCWRPR